VDTSTILQTAASWLAAAMARVSLKQGKTRLQTENIVAYVKLSLSCHYKVVFANLIF
jgi:hypothetical protein